MGVSPPPKAEAKVGDKGEGQDGTDGLECQECNPIDTCVIVLLLSCLDLNHITLH